MKRTPHLIWTILPLLAWAMPGFAHAAPSAGAASSWFLEQGYVPPEGGRIVACHGYGCARRTAITLDASWLARADALLRAGRRSPQAERRALSDVVKLYTAYLSAQIGVRDTPRSPPSLSGRKGQMDCVDESANTTSLLLSLQDRGWLVYHRVERPQTRGFFFDGRYPHTTAVIAETRTATEWAVDPWAKAPGQTPDILPLSEWRQES